jgi:hypothetical protein
MSDERLPLCALALTPGSCMPREKLPSHLLLRTRPSLGAASHGDTVHHQEAELVEVNTLLLLRVAVR